MVISCLIYSICGVIIGGILALAFIKMNPTSKSFLKGKVELPIAIITLYPINLYMGITIENERFLSCTFWYLLSVLFSFCLVLIITLYFIKTQDEKIKIRVLDVLLGYKDFIKQYYDSRNQENDIILNRDKAHEEYNKLCSEVNVLKEKREKLNNQLSDGISLKLPVNQEMPIDDAFIACVPEYSNSLAEFYNSLQENTTSFISLYKEKKEKGEKVDDVEFLIGFLASICSDINNILFSCHTPQVRTHIRVKNGDVYSKLIAYIGSSKFNESIKDMPYENSVISYAFKNKCSIIKSINPIYHCEGNNDEMWKNYITFTTPNILTNDGFPLLSFGISITNEYSYNNRLYYINMCHIERIISKFVSQVNSVCSMMVLEDFYKNR